MPEPTAPGVTVRAPAKINLHLGVGPVRPDGFHPLATAYQAISLFSTVTATPAEDWSVTCTAAVGIDVAGVPLDDTNLAMRAARLLAAEAGVDQPVALHLDKGIPVAGGLAGGSADGAAALLACSVLWDLSLPPARLLELAGELGIEVAARPLRPDDLHRSGEVFLTSSVRGIRPARSLDGKPLRGHATTDRLATELRRRWLEG